MVETCAKCHKAEAEFVLRSAPLCAACVVHNGNHKYRMAVTRGLRDRRARPIAIAVAVAPGGAASRLLVHYTQQDVNAPQTGSRALFLYRYFTLVSLPDETTKLDGHAELQEEAERSVIKVDLARALFSDGPSDGTSGVVAQSRLHNLFAQCKDKELAHELRCVLLRIAMVRVARLWLGTPVVFVGDTCSRQAADVIADTCFGRGREIPWRVAALQDYASLNVGVVRPLVELLRSEVSDVLCVLSRNVAIPSCVMESFGQLNPEPQLLVSPESSYGLVDSFVCKLESSNVATATTIVRTAAKIETDVLSDAATQCCPLCLAPSESASFCYGCSRIADSLPARTVLPPYAQRLVQSALLDDAQS